MRLTVLSVAYPLAPVGAQGVGGAERVLAQLDAALVRAGHRSVVVAAEGSTVAGTLVATPRWPAPFDEPTRRAAVAAHRGAIGQALRQWPVDVVHLHGIDCGEYLPKPGVPVLVTLHLPPAWYPAELFTSARPRTFVQCVSASQRRACPPMARPIPVIENGVELCASRHAKRNFALSLGRICPEKGFHLALEAAGRARLPWLLAGQVFPYPAHEQYFEHQLAPRFNAHCRFLGPVFGARKRRLLAGARCLVVPSLVAETSSLVAMEALACGTPVVAFPAGALAEIVEPGQTGFLVRDPAELAEAMLAAGVLDPERCRYAARTRFGLDPMIGRYFELYERLVLSQEPGEGLLKPGGGRSVER